MTEEADPKVLAGTADGASRVSQLPAGFPAWATKLAELYFSGTTSMFLLHGNVYDLVRSGVGADARWGGIAEFVAEQLFGRWDVVIHYDLARGLRPLAARSDLDIWSRRLVVAGMVIAPAFVALVLILGLRAAFAYFRLRVELIDIAMDLVTALALVRIGVHALSVSLGPNSWIRSWELRLTFVIWAAIAFQVLGWFSGIERTLDGIDLLPGKSQFSLWSLLKGIVVIAGFLVVTSLVARTIDAIKTLKESFGLTVLMAEQNFTQAVRIANRGYVIVHGKIEFEGASAAELNNNDLIRKFYMGM